MPRHMLIAFILLVLAAGGMSYYLWEKGHKFWVMIIVGAHGVILGLWALYAMIFRSSDDEVTYVPRTSTRKEPPPPPQEQDWQSSPPPPQKFEE